MSRLPPNTGEIVQYSWSIDGKADPMTVVDKPQPAVSVNRTITFDKPGTYHYVCTLHSHDMHGTVIVS